MQRLWVAAAVAVAAVAGAVAGTVPQATFLATAAACLIWLILMAPTKAILVGAGLTAFWSRTAERVTGLSELGLADELAVLLMVAVALGRRVLSRRPVRGIPGGAWFAVFLVIGFAGALVNGVPVDLAVQGVFLSGKGLLFALAVAQVDWTTRDLERGARSASVVLGVLAATAILQLIDPNRWAAIFHINGVVDRRGFIPSLTGPFVHPAEYAHIMAAGAVACFAWRQLVGRGLVSGALMVAATLGSLLAFRRKTIASIILAMAQVRLPVGRLAGSALALLLISPIAMIAFAGTVVEGGRNLQYEYLSDAENTARTVLYRGAPEVAADHFPLGAGFARYGSYLAGQHYSPEYVDRGYQYVTGLGPGPGRGFFLNDAQWPAILGEAGFFGAAAYAAGLWAIYRHGRRLFRLEVLPIRRWVGLVLIGWSVLWLIESVASPAYYATPMYPLLFGLVGLAAGMGDARVASSGMRRAQPSGVASSGRLDAHERATPRIATDRPWRSAEHLPPTVQG